MNSHQPTPTTRIKVTFRELLAKLRDLLTVAPRPQLVPIRVRPEQKNLKRKRNEGGR